MILKALSNLLRKPAASPRDAHRIAFTSIGPTDITNERRHTNAGTARPLSRLVPAEHDDDAKAGWLELRP